MKHQKNNENAVSPVVGVMLMVVITIVIAAVITVFATGLLGDESTTTPMIMIHQGDITTKQGAKGTCLYSVDFIHKGGDEMALENMEFTLVSSRQQITNYFPGYLGIVTVSGKSEDGVVATAGDTIKISLSEKGGASYNELNAQYYSGETVTWTMYDKRTDGIIAQGDFVVP